MANRVDQLKQVVKFLDPRVGLRLAQAGAAGPRRVAAAYVSIPWVLGRGPSLGVLAQINAAANGAKTAIVDRNGSLTWLELEARTNRLARALREQGVKPGDVVATLLRNGREQLEVLVATQKLGIAAAPLNTWARTKELATTFERTTPSFLFFDPRHLNQVKPAIGERVPAVPVGEPYEDLIAPHSGLPLPPVTVKGSEPRVVIHTSGTTGKPKAAARSAASAGAMALVGLLGRVPYRSDDLIVCPAPLFHSFGLLTASLSLLLGCTIVLPEKFDPAETLKLIEEHQATAVSMVPVMIGRILELPKAKRTKHDLSSLRILLASGSAIGPETRKRAMELFGPVLYDLYGSTEAGWVAIATPEDMSADLRTLGRPVPGVEVAVFGDDGDKLEQGETGTLHIKSDAIFEGYSSGEDVEFRDGYLNIGDVGYLDEDGRLYVEGRSDDMVVVGGENVYPAEIEEVIEGLPGVRAVAVVGVPDEEFGQVLAAFVEGKADPERIKAACKKELASFKVPRLVEVVDELPRTETGKVRKKQLAEQLDDREGGGRRPA